MLFTPRPKGLGKDSFLKLADGEEVTGVFRGEIYTFKRHWIQSEKRGYECTGEGCPICPKAEKGPAFRFRINFLVNAGGVFTAKIFEGGGEMYDELSSLDKKFNLKITPVEITRRGTGQGTKYSLMARMDQPVTKELEKQLSAVKLLPLTAQEEPAA